MSIAREARLLAASAAAMGHSRTDEQIVGDLWPNDRPRIEIADWTRWSSPSFEGASVTLSGVEVDPDVEFDIRGWLVADHAVTAKGRTEFILVRDGADKPFTTDGAGQALLGVVRAWARLSAAMASARA